MVAALQKNSSSLLALADSPGAALVFDNEITCLGATPQIQDIRNLVEWLRERKQNLFVSSHLSQEYPSAQAFTEKASGIIAVSIPRHDSAMIIWFRPEMKEQIPWAGNPNLSKTVSRDGRIHPRSSFATWLQSNEGVSRKWQDSHLTGVDQLRSAIITLSLRDGIGQLSQDEMSSVRLALANVLATTVAPEGETSLKAPPEEEESVANLNSLVHSGRLLYEGFAEVSLIILDEKGNLQNWSAGAKILLGFLDNSTQNRPFTEFFSEDEVMGGRAERLFDKARLLGRAEEELWLYRNDKSSFWAHLVISRILNAEGDVIGFSVVIRDITDDKSIEEELRATKLAAEAANVAKTSFIANISHEIRTPLGAILGFSEVMAQRNQSADERDVLYSRIKRNGDQLIALINDLLDVTKIEAGRLEVEKIPFDLQNLLCDLRDTFKIKAAEKSLVFRIVVKDKLPKVVICDPTRIRQILVNLLSNAIKFTDNGGSVTLICSMDPLLQGSRLSFRVVDTGRGMTEAEMSKLFQPFVQADVSMTREYGGTGLGLFVSQRLARGLGGDLNIESSVPGEGTTFLARVHVDHDSSKEVFSTLENFERSVTSSAVTLTNLNFNDKRVLVVDDASDNRALVGHFLKDTLVQIDYAENGVEALKMIRTHSYDLVLMDIQMPVMDGNKAMESLRADAYDKPVIALTANAMQGEREISLGLGFKDYLTKPINRRSLRQALAKWLL